MGSGQLSTRWLSDGTMVVGVRGEIDLASTVTLRDGLSAEVIAIKPPDVLVDLGRDHLDGQHGARRVSQRSAGCQQDRGRRCVVDRWTR
jgi:anti-anti-sigma regulatory factor